MIPEFPEFKKLELSDREEIESFTKKFPPYSDFNFVSMWSWDIKDEMALSVLNGNLVVKFTDYLSGDPFYSFIGTNQVTETAKALLLSSENNDWEISLHLIPKDVAQHISTENQDLSVLEKIDHHDYIYSVESLVSFEGSLLKTQRNTLNSFTRKYPNFLAKVIDLSDPDIHFAILKLYKIWEINNNTNVPHEFLALKRCLTGAKKFNLFGLGIFINDELVGFNVNQKESEDFATCYFAKGNIKYSGVYSVLMNETAKVLSDVYSVKYYNYEQDLGLFNLRKSKKAFNPVYFLEKFSIIHTIK